jgi:hypothetical protein
MEIFEANFIVPCQVTCVVVHMRREINLKA